MEDTYTKPSGKLHLGRNIARIRELKGMKQEALAVELGVSQQAVSVLEQKETMDKEKLEELPGLWALRPKPLRPLAKKQHLALLTTIR